MGKHIVKCRACRQEMDVDKLVEGVDWIQPTRMQYYHMECYKAFYKHRIPIADISEREHLDEAYWLERTKEYLAFDVKLEVDWTKFSSQWKNFLTKNMTPIGIYYAIRFFYEIEHGDKKKADGGIGIIPFVYNRSKEYWANRLQEDKAIRREIETQINQINIGEKKVVNQRNTRTNSIKIDWQDIADLEEYDD